MLLIPVIFVVYSIYSLSKEEEYFGIVKNNGLIKKLVSEDKEVVYDYQLPNDGRNIKKNDWIKITFTERRRTILKQEIVKEDEVPNMIKRD